MPIYEYVCDDCHARYEQLIRSAGQKVSCPKCASTRHTLQLSVFSAGHSSSSNGGSTFAGASSGECGMGTCGCAGSSCDVD